MNIVTDNAARSRFELAEEGRLAFADYIGVCNVRYPILLQLRWKVYMEYVAQFGSRR